MTFYMPGDRVIFTDDFWEDLYGRESTVVSEFCDYGDHKLEVVFDGETEAREMGIDYFEHSEDPYEYAVQITSHTGYVHHLNSVDWNSLDTTKRMLKNMEEMWAWQKVNSKGKILKRRKAGKVQDYVE